MSKIVVVGAGLNTEAISSFMELQQNNIDQFPEKLPAHNNDALLTKEIKFHSSKKISREDRSLLSESAQLSIDSAVEAFEMAEKIEPYSIEEKKAFPIFIGNESFEHNSYVTESFTKTYQDDEALQWLSLGKIKNLLNPLDMMRLLSTNSLYHTSKVLGLHGGGYPLRRMSLSSLCAVEEAFTHLKTGTQRALIAASGNLKNLESLCAFKKMSLIRKNKEDSGIIPSFGSAAIVLEKIEESIARKVYAEILDARSIYKPDNQVNSKDWLKLFNFLPKFEEKKLTIITYNNGIQKLAEEESQAIQIRFPHAKQKNYKKYYGYTGKANNLIDFVTALADKSILPGEYILVNGVGMSAGLGYLFFQKTSQVGI